jgi:hypothetical protein
MVDKEIEKGFESTAGIIFGKPLSNLLDYEKWLSRYTRARPILRKSALSEAIVCVADRPYFRKILKGVAGLEESLEFGKKAVQKEQLGKLRLSNARETLREIAKTSPEIFDGMNVSMDECAGYGWSRHCFRGTYFVESKHTAYCFWPRESEYIFGSAYLFSSKFCIRCFNSEKLARCFEVSDANSCSDCYFCYNVENLENCMFCFNTKAKRYAIANVEVGKEEYLRIKKLVLAELAEKIEKDRGLGIDIYNIACYGPKKTGKRA